ncbi:MAG: hypothetical protein FWD89_02075 [Firmicutes bacterium]|nr:hypothetical protein [Bacillota bacterium]
MSKKYLLYLIPFICFLVSLIAPFIERGVESIGMMLFLPILPFYYLAGQFLFNYEGLFMAMMNILFYISVISFVALTVVFIVKKAKKTL